MVSISDWMVNTLERLGSTEGMMGSMWGSLGNGGHHTRGWQGNRLHHSSAASRVSEQGSIPDCTQSPMGQERRQGRSYLRPHLLASRQPGMRVLHPQAKESHLLLPPVESLPLQTCLLASWASC